MEDNNVLRKHLTKSALFWNICAVSFARLGFIFACFIAALLKRRGMSLSIISDLICMCLPASVHGKVTVSIEVLTSPSPNLDVFKPFCLITFALSSLGRNSWPSELSC